MRKLLMSMLLVCIFLSGCSNSNVKDEALPNEEETTSMESREVYIQKLNDVEASLVDLQDLYDEGTTVSMKTAAEETYKRWDTALNEIYSVLKQQLSTIVMDELMEEQVRWLTYRDDIAKAESLEFEGGTMESLVYISTLSRVTKERCYVLVEYMMK